MPVSRHLGPWRAVPVLGATQFLAWGTLFYPPVLTLPAIATDRGWSITFAMAGFPWRCWQPAARRRWSGA